MPVSSSFRASGRRASQWKGKKSLITAAQPRGYPDSSEELLKNQTFYELSDPSSAYDSDVERNDIVHDGDRYGSEETPGGSGCWAVGDGFLFNPSMSLQHSKPQEVVLLPFLPHPQCYSCL